LARQRLKGIEPTAMLPIPPQVDTDRLAAEVFLRMLFSALVDADFLDTEAHFQEAGQEVRQAARIGLEELWRRLEQSQQWLMAGCSGPVAQARREIYDYCLAAAGSPPGLFRLTVPTGGGKTRSGMAFALRHALLHGMQRIIVAVPFISITEQTAEVYREIFEAGDDQTPVVLEHHSAFLLQEEDEFSPRAQWTRLAAENWDAPIIVTTTVQLFESLFGNSPSTTRKLHRLARSVIILDEAQALPPHLLTPILDVLGRLCTDYGSSVVFSTATQPAFETIQAFAGIAATEIVPQPERYFAALKRVRYEWYTERALSWDEVAALIKDEPQVLVVLNTKADALALLDALGDPAALHLSTLLCGAHRRHVIREVKRRLVAGEPCRLVSTQVIEAGVDLDFPLVLRALGPLDSVIQAAGRCNREGKLPCGRVIVFRPQDGGLPPGAYKAAAGITARIQAEGHADPDDPAFARRYFRLLYETIDTDREEIQRCGKS
jgi:CRISPR-associated endonuclease/helicase Cas3